MFGGKLYRGGGQPSPAPGSRSSVAIVPCYESEERVSADADLEIALEMIKKNRGGISSTVRDELAIHVAGIMRDARRDAEAALARKVRAAIDAELRGNGYTLDDVRQEAAVHATCETVTLSRAIVAALEALPAEPKLLDPKEPGR